MAIPSSATGIRGGDVARDETHSLISADKVQGTAVYSMNGERMGSIEDIMLDKRSGRVAYAILSFGGFLGIGERYHPLPWNTLTYNVELGGYQVALPVDRLKEAPSYAIDESPDLEDRAYGQKVHDYYGAPPYWMPAV